MEVLFESVWMNNGDSYHRFVLIHGLKKTQEYSVHKEILPKDFISFEEAFKTDGNYFKYNELNKEYQRKIAYDILSKRMCSDMQFNSPVLSLTIQYKKYKASLR